MQGKVTSYDFVEEKFSHHVKFDDGDRVVSRFVLIWH